MAKDQKKTKTQIGTCSYMAPEVIESEKYDFKADIWSLGITLFELITFHFPFKGNNEYGLMMNIINGKKTMSINNINGYQYSEELIYIINRMIQKKPEDRPTIADIFDVPIIKKNLKEFLEKNKDLYKDLHLSINDEFDNNKEFKNKSANGIMLNTINEESEDREYSRLETKRKFSQNTNNFIQMAKSINSNISGLNNSLSNNMSKNSSIKNMPKTHHFQ